MPEEQFTYIGRSIPRADGPDKVRGKARYVGDLKMSGMLYARLVLSDHAHAEIRALDLSAARSTPGVVKAYGGRDVPRMLYNSHNWLPDMKGFEDEPLLTDRPRHHGDRIAVVVAESEAAALSAASKIRPEYEDLPPVLGFDAALDPGVPPIHPYGNVPFDGEKGYGDFQAAAAGADRIVEDTVETPAQHHGAIEPHACLAYMEDDVLVVKTPCQITYQVQLLLAAVTGLPHSRIRVIKSLTGGSFGGKSQPVIEPLCGFLAADLGRPILMVLDREQSILGTRRRNSVRGRVRLAVAKDGRILGRDLDVIADTGAYYGNGTAVSMAMLKKAMRLYRMDAQRYRARAVVTNTPVAGAARGYGSPQIHAVTEINVENAARALGMDPLEFRLMNIVRPGDPDPLGGPSLGNVQIEACLRKGAERFGWEKKLGRPRGNGRYRRGAGMAAIVHGNGYFGGYPEFSVVRISLLPDGGILVDSALHDLGCGTVTVAAQIVAEALGVDLESVRILESDTHRSPYDPAGTQACRVTYVCGEALRLGAETLKAKLLDRASDLLGTSREGLRLEGGRILDSRGTALTDLPALAARSIRERMEPLALEYRYEARSNPGTYGANFAEVEVDTWTGLVEVLHIVAAHDIGRAVNPDFVRGQIYGGIQMNLGFALYEEMPVSASGLLRSGSLSRYHMVNAPIMPPVDIVLIEEGEPFGPYGAKSIGESSSIATAPAVINAINAALGTRISVLPATPERVVEALACLDQDR